MSCGLRTLSEPIGAEDGKSYYSTNQGVGDPPQNVGTAFAAKPMFVCKDSEIEASTWASAGACD